MCVQSCVACNLCQISSRSPPLPLSAPWSSTKQKRLGESDSVKCCSPAFTFCVMGDAGMACHSLPWVCEACLEWDASRYKSVTVFNLMCVCVCVCVCVYITEDSSVNVWVSGFSLGLDGQAGHSVPCDGCFFFFFYFFPLWRWSLWKDLLSVLTCGMCNPSCHSDGALPVIRRVSARRDRCEMFPHRISLTEAFLKGCDGGGPDASSSESKTQMCEPASHLDGNINTAAITITSQTFGPYKDWGITSVLIKALICQQMCEEQKITHDWFSCFESQWELLMCAYVYIKGISSTHSEQLSEQLAVDGCYKLLRGLNLLP